MKLSLSPSELCAFLDRVLATVVPDGRERSVAPILDAALARLERCFENVVLPGYCTDGEPAFNHLHGDQSATLIYLLSNQAWRSGDVDLASALFLCNKVRNSMVCMFDTQLPAEFLLLHTVGLMLGKATYGNRFIAFQNVTIGHDRGEYLTIEENVIVYGGSVVVGGGTIGSNSVIAPNSTVVHESVPPNSIIAGRSPDLRVAARKRDVIGTYFRS